MIFAKDILDLARLQIGYQEKPGNLTKYGEWYGMNGQPWCGMMISWLFDRAGLPLPKIQSYKGFAYCPYAVNYYRKLNLFFTRNPEVGDIVFFDWGKDGIADHVGLVEQVYPTHLITIEGNTSLANQSNGGMVMRRTRYYASIQGYVRPNYDDLPEDRYSWDGGYIGLTKPLTRGDRVLKIQHRLIDLGCKLMPDGVYGEKTKLAVMQFQSKKGLEIDGVVGAATWEALFS